MIIVILSDGMVRPKNNVIGDCKTMLTKYYDSMLKPFDTFRIFDDLYGTTWNLRAGTHTSSYRVNTTDRGLELSLDLPGVKSRDLSVKVTGRTLEVSGKLRDEDFRHTYRISKDFDPDTVDATLEDGVLTLMFDRLKEGSKTIDVKLK